MAEINNVIAEASQDLQTIEDFVNLPADSEVYPRLLPSVNVGTLAGTRQAIFEAGGLPAKPFPTKDSMETEGASLADGQLAVVYNETANNGLYVKTVGTWVKAAYDPLTRTIKEINKTTKTDENANLLDFKDANDTTYAYFGKDGGLNLAGQEASVQTIFLDIKNSAPKTDESSTLFTFEDNNDKPVMQLNNDGSLIVNDVITAKGSVENRLSYIENKPEREPDTQTKVDTFKLIDTAIAARDKKPMLQTFNLFTYTELNAVFAFAPSLCRISENEYIAICEARNGGDFGESWLVQRKLTINDDYTTTLGAVSIFADKGTEAEQPFSCINSCIVKVETGAHAGRIYCYYLKVFYQNQRDVLFYKYSDNNGETWSAEVNMTPFFPDIASWKLVVAGAGGKAIQLKEGAHRGRIIIPCWHGDEQYYDHIQTGLRSFILYSDDGGETYQIGAKSSFAGSNECQVAELDGGGFMLLVRDGSTTKRTEVSFDGGLTLEQPRALGNINSNTVESGFCQFKNIYDLSVPKLMITSPTEVNRYNLGLYSSYDNGENFELVKILSQGRASYSDILPIDESHILTAHSAGIGEAPDKNIECNIVNLKSILLGE